MLMSWLILSSIKVCVSFIRILTNCQKNSASNLVKDLLIFDNHKEVLTMFNIIFNRYIIACITYDYFTIYHLHNEFNLFSFDANNAVIYCYKGCYFPHQNIVWSNTFTKIPELNVQANILNPRIYSFKTTSTNNSRAW